MRSQTVRLLTVAAVALALSSGAPQAASELVETIAGHLYAGQTAAAASAAEDRLAIDPADDEARFALGAIEFLQAVENLGQGLHRHGLDNGGSSLSGMAGLPILRLPVPANSDPEPLTYEAFRGLLEGFAEDLERAERTLAGVEGDAVDLPLQIGLVRLDLDGDGTGSEDEALWLLLAEVAQLNWLIDPAASQILVDFDGSDVPWLRGYCHVLMAIAEFPLAHDFEPAFDATFHGVFPRSDLPGAKLNEWTEHMPPEMAEAMWFAGAADLVAFIHLNRWRVAETQRMQAVLGHLEAIPTLSRENWRRILAETDDRNEWIPSPAQSGAFPGLAVTEDQVQGWMLFLDEFEALLQGEKLLPHWRFQEGVNLRRIFLEPRTFDVVLLIQGFGALPYLETGELTSQETWFRITQLFGGNFFRYAVWFN